MKTDKDLHRTTVLRSQSKTSVCKARRKQWFVGWILRCKLHIPRTKGFSPDRPWSNLFENVLKHTKIHNYWWLLDIGDVDWVSATGECDILHCAVTAVFSRLFHIEWRSDCDMQMCALISDNGWEVEATDARTFRRIISVGRPVRRQWWLAFNARCVGTLLIVSCLIVVQTNKIVAVDLFRIRSVVAHFWKSKRF